MDNNPKAQGNAFSEQGKRHTVLICDAFNTIGITNIITITPFATIMGTKDKNVLRSIICNALVNDKEFCEIVTDSIGAILQNSCPGNPKGFKCNPN
jgi:hypothetical protein